MDLSHLALLPNMEQGTKTLHRKDAVTSAQGHCVNMKFHVPVVQGFSRTTDAKETALCVAWGYHILVLPFMWVTLDFVQVLCGFSRSDVLDLSIKATCHLHVVFYCDEWIRIPEWAGL